MRARFFFLDGVIFRFRCASTGHGGIGNKMIFPVSYLDQRIGSRALISLSTTPSAITISAQLLFPTSLPRFA